MIHKIYRKQHNKNNTCDASNSMSYFLRQNKDCTHIDDELNNQILSDIPKL